MLLSINIAATVNRACRRPEVPTNHTERERDDLFVPHDELYGVIANESASVAYTQVRRRQKSGEKDESREATEETEDLSRRQFGLTDLIRLATCLASVAMCRPADCRRDADS